MTNRISSFSHSVGISLFWDHNDIKAMKTLCSDLMAIYQSIGPHIHRTPVLQSRLTNDRANAKIYFKCENFQRMGAFKMRGALAAMQRLSAAEKERGVVTHSSGNFAQALSLAAQSLGFPAYIVMPSSAPEVKKAAVKAYGGKVFEVEPTMTARESKAREIMEKEGATFIHPSNDYEVILGQGTAAVELLLEVPDLDVVVSPVGGGGLLAGSSVASHFLGKQGCKTYGAEPRTVNDAYASFHSGEIHPPTNGNTIADGLRTQLGDVNFPMIQKYVEDIVLVEESEIVEAMRWIWERLKIVVEPSAAVPLAAVFKSGWKGKIGIVISGGNVDLDQLPF